MPIELKHAAQVMATLAQIGGAPARRMVRQGVAAAGRVVAKAAKGLVPNESGTLKRSMGSKVKTYDAAQVVMSIVGPRTKWGRHVGVQKNGVTVIEFRDPSKYAMLVELGTAHSAAKPFLRPAASQSKGRVVSVIRQKLWSGLKSYAAKQAAKARG